MPVVEEELDPVLLRLDRIGRVLGDQSTTSRPVTEARIRRGAVVLRTCRDHTGLLGDLVAQIEERGSILHEGDALA
jgi:hypothetical protein